MATKPSKELSKKLARLRELIGECQDLSAAGALLSWDQEIHMPKDGVGPRSKQMGTISTIHHEKMTSKEMGALLKALREPKTFKTLGPVEQALVRETGKDYDKATRLPVDFVRELAETCAMGQAVWAEARAKSDFAMFAPHLKKLIELKKREAKYLGYKGSPYNALLDHYEPDLSVEKLDPLFAKLKKDLVPLVKAIAASKKKPDLSLLKKTYGEKAQERISLKVLKLMHYDLDRGRLDVSVHPFTTEMGAPFDVRVTTRYTKNDPREALSSTMHEGGHALYEQGMDEALLRTGLGVGSSLGIHESQSRLWENQVGRGREFWQFFFPTLKKTFPKQLAKYTAESYYRATNDVRPSFIRVEADEVTYNLHILLRYEMEKAIFEGKLAVEDIPKTWNKKMQDYLGITPKNDAEGCLQDVHWSMGGFGYFPTYTLGNLYGAQFYAEAKKQMPTLEKDIAKGKLKPLKAWLNKAIHHLGRMETPEQIIQRVTGKPLDSKFFIAYLWDKYGDLYQIKRR